MFSGKGEVLITHAFPSLHPYAGLHYFSAGGVREWEGGQVGLERKGRRKWVWSGERLEMRDRTRGHMEREVKGMKCERRERRSEGESICGRSWLCPKALASLLLLTINISPSHITSLLPHRNLIHLSAHGVTPSSLLFILWNHLHFLFWMHIRFNLFDGFLKICI